MVRRVTLPCLALGAILLSIAPVAADETWELINPTGIAYTNEPVRVRLPLPSTLQTEPHSVLEDDIPVPFQVESVEGRPAVWVAASLTNGQTRTYRIQRGAPSAAAPMPLVRVQTEADSIVLDNGVFAVRVPAVPGTDTPAPIRAVRSGTGKWLGGSAWNTPRRLSAFSATVTGDGTVFGRVRLRYHFTALPGEATNFTPRSEIQVTLRPGTQHVRIEESHTLGPGEAWQFDCAAGWAPRHAIVQPHDGGFDRPTLHAPDGTPYDWPPTRLVPGQTRMGDTLLDLSPRWRQTYDEGWFFAAHDGTNAIGAAAVNAGRWSWPQDNWIAVRVRPTGDAAILRAPTWRGRRSWFLLGGPVAAWSATQREAYVIRHSLETLDKLHGEYILNWPGLPDGQGDGHGRMARRTRINFHWGKSGWAAGGDWHPVTLLTRAQGWFDPDNYGSYWLHGAPENPNIANTWLQQGFRDMGKLHEHPDFPLLSRFAEMKFREDLYHSVTLPGGAGQECPGHLSDSMEMWKKLAPRCAEQLGFDPRTWPRYRAAASFLQRLSVPQGDGTRHCHPGGDTHPPGPDVFALSADRGVLEDVRTFRSEEFPGFGAVLRHRSGEPLETYLAFKSGPNRGHYHGDQLSLHYAPNGRPQVVDHRCSDRPRAGQEHMHNRVSFHSDALPYANMDGYERLIAFHTNALADIAVGQVGSTRLRATEPFPPEKWDWQWPRETLERPLRYRRTVVLVKGGPQDYVVLRDQFDGPELFATWNLHVYGDACEARERTIDFDGLRVFVAAPQAWELTRHDWQHSNGGLESTRGVRLTTRAAAGEFVTVLYPRPLRPCRVVSLRIPQSLTRVDRPRGASAVTTTNDLLVTLTHVDGLWLTNAVHVTAPDYAPRAVFRSATTVEERRDRLAVTLRATGRRASPRPLVDLALDLRRRDGVVSGSAKGEIDGKRFEGPVEGTWVEDALAPVPVYAPFVDPGFDVVPGGVRVGDDTIVFHGSIDGEGDGAPAARVTRGEQSVELPADAIDLNRSQGEIGLFVPDAGNPFGDIPDWLIRQRATPPAWYTNYWPLAEHRGTAGRESREER